MLEFSSGCSLIDSMFLLPLYEVIFYIYYFQFKLVFLKTDFSSNFDKRSKIIPKYIGEYLACQLSLTIFHMLLTQMGNIKRQ